MVAKMAAENLNLMYLCFMIPASTHACYTIGSRTRDTMFPQMAPYMCHKSNGAGGN